jgi:hypothetical protein
MGLSDKFKNAWHYVAKSVVVGTAMAAGILTATDAHADGVRKPLAQRLKEAEEAAQKQKEAPKPKEQPKKEEKPAPSPRDLSITDSPRVQRKKLNDLFGYVKTDAMSSPSSQGIGMSFKVGRRKGNTRFAVLGRTGFWEYDSDGPDLQVNSHLLGASIGHYLENTPKLEVYGELYAMGEASFFRNNIDMNAGRGIAGLRLGVASQESGSIMMLNFAGGHGRYDAEFLSGLENDGPFNTAYLSAGIAQRLTEGKPRAYVRRQEISDDLDVLISGDMAGQFDKALYATLQGYLRRDEYGKLLTSQGIGGRLSFPTVFNVRDYKVNNDGQIEAEGWLFRFTPFAQAELSETESELSLRTTASEKYKFGLDVTAEYATVTGSIGLSGGIGYQQHHIRIDDGLKDPAFHVREVRKLDGVDIRAAIYFKFG